MHCLFLICPLINDVFIHKIILDIVFILILPMLLMRLIKLPDALSEHKFIITRIEM